MSISGAADDFAHGSDVIHSRYVRDTMYSAEAGVIFCSRLSSRSHSFRASAGMPDSSSFFAQLLDFRLRIVGFAELLLNRLHLLAQQILALALAHLLLHLLLDLVAQLQDFDLFRQFADQCVQALAHVRGLEQFLPQQRG